MQFTSKGEMDSWMGRMRPRIKLIGVRTSRRLVFWEGLPKEIVTYTVTYEEKVGR